MNLVERAKTKLEEKGKLIQPEPFLFELCQAVIDSEAAMANLKKVMLDKDFVRIEAYGLIGELSFHSATEKVDNWLKKYGGENE